MIAILGVQPLTGRCGPEGESGFFVRRRSSIARRDQPKTLNPSKNRTGAFPRALRPERTLAGSAFRQAAMRSLRPEFLPSLDRKRSSPPPENGGAAGCPQVRGSRGSLGVESGPCLSLVRALSYLQGKWMGAMNDAVGPGDLVLCVNIAPNHATGRPVPFWSPERPTVSSLSWNLPAHAGVPMPCSTWSLTSRGAKRLLPKPKAESKQRCVSAPKERETIR